MYLTVFHVQISTSKERNPAERHMFFITVHSITSVSIRTATKSDKKAAGKMQIPNANVFKCPSDMTGFDF